MKLMSCNNKPKYMTKQRPEERKKRRRRGRNRSRSREVEEQKKKYQRTTRSSLWQGQVGERERDRVGGSWVNEVRQPGLKCHCKKGLPAVSGFRASMGMGAVPPRVEGKGDCA